jgi:hypothetical protein
MESDEEFARRLQAQEMGLRPIAGERTANNATGENPTIINARLNEIATTRATVAVIFIVHFPQIVAALIILPMHWNDLTPCSQVQRDVILILYS